MDINGDTVLQHANGCGKCFVTEFGPSPVCQSPDQTEQHSSAESQKYSTDSKLATTAAEEGLLFQTLAQCMKRSFHHEQTINIKVNL